MQCRKTDLTNHFTTHRESLSRDHVTSFRPRLDMSSPTILVTQTIESIETDDHKTLAPDNADAKSDPRHDTFVRVGQVNSCSHIVVDVNHSKDPAVTKKELWAYYLYFSGATGLGPNIYSLTLLQSLATKTAFDARLGRDHPCSQSTPSSVCLIPWGNSTKSVSSAILIANEASFAVMTLLFAIIGSAADYGSFGRWLLLILTLICWAAQFASMSLTSPNRWVLAMVLYMIGFVSYGAITIFSAAPFPRLARNTPRARTYRAKYERGEISAEEFEAEQSMEMNEISNVRNTSFSLGYLTTLILNLSILIPSAKNPKIGNYTIVLTNSYWVMAGIWWFIFQQPRPTSKLPKGETYLTIGWKQSYEALKQYKKLPNTFIYLVASFLLTNGFNTMGSLVNICQNDKFQFSFLQTTYLGLTQAVSATLSCFGFWYVQRYWKIKTRTMFTIVNVLIIIIPLWGMLGIWSTKIGFHNSWEFWAFNVIRGLITPYWSFSRTLIAELTPPGFENMFFALFGLSSQASSIIGPNIIQIIINATQSNWQGFPFLFALCTTASLIIWFYVDVQKGQRDAIKFSDGSPSQSNETQPVNLSSL